jgi:putative oxidoreductase
MTTRREDLTSIGLLILRLGIGGYLLSHGVGKLHMLLAGDFASFGDPIHIGSAPSLVLVTMSEFLCALLLIVGLGTHFAAVPVVISMSVAVFVAHAGNPWSSETAAKAFFSGTSKDWFSKEPAMMYLIVALCLAFTGAGAFSLDGVIARRRQPAAKV